MPLRIIATVSILATLAVTSCAAPPVELIESELLVVVGQTAHHFNPEPLLRASWPLPDVDIDIVEAAVEATVVDTEWQCWIWAGPLVGPRAIGRATLLAMTEPVGFTESVVVDVDSAVRQRRDREVTCEATEPSLFHGLRVWTVPAVVDAMYRRR